MKQRSKRTRSPHTHRTRGISAALALILIFGSLWYLPTVALGYTGEGNTAKISADLLARMEASEDPDEMFSVDVWLNLISPEAIDTEMQATYGISLQSFENEEIYEAQTLPAIEAEAAQVFAVKNADQPVGAVLRANTSAYGLERAAATDTAAMTGALKQHVPVLEYMSDKTLERGIETQKTALEIYQIAKSKQFKSYRNASVKKLITAQTDRFLTKLEDEEYTVTYKGQYVALVTILTTEATIRYISTFSEVTGIHLYEESDSVVNQTATNSISDSANAAELTEAMKAEMAELQSNGTDYTGFGVTIGILEAIGEPVSGGYQEGINRSLPQFYGADIMWYDYPYENDLDYPITGTSDHAIAVTSIIAAQEAPSGYDFEEGIASEASVVGMSFYEETQFRNRINTLINDNEVDVINMSAGGGHPEYDSISRYVDNFIVQNNILIVMSAGNIPANFNDTGEIDSSDYDYVDIEAPAHAYNAIVVGSAKLEFLNSSSIFPVLGVTVGGSCYYQSEGDTATNKPDLCAFEQVSCPVGKEEPYTEVGSSFATPRVTATIALMIEADSSLRHQIAQIKAIILAAASNTVLSLRGNDLLTDSEVLRQRSGAGLLNVERSCELAASRCYYRTVINLQRTQYVGEYASFTRDELNVTAGQKIRVALWYTKPEEYDPLFSLNPNNIDLHLTYYNNSDTPVASSVSVKNNVEVIEYTATQTGRYYIRIDLTSYEQVPADSNLYSIIHIGVSYCIVS